MAQVLQQVLQQAPCSPPIKMDGARSALPRQSEIARRLCNVAYGTRPTIGRLSEGQPTLSDWSMSRPRQLQITQKCRIRRWVSHGSSADTAFHPCDGIL